MRGHCEGGVREEQQQTSWSQQSNFQCCQVLNLNSREGYSYPSTFQQCFNGNSRSIPFVPCLKDEASEEGAALEEMSLNFCHASKRQERSNHRKKPQHLCK